MPDIPVFKLVPVTLQGRHVDVIHRIVVYKIPVVSVFVGITYHGLDFALIAMIVALMIALESPLIHIPVDIDRLITIYGLGYMGNKQYSCVIILYNLHILVFQQIGTYLLAINGIPEVLPLAFRMVDAINSETFVESFSIQILFDTQYDIAPVGVGKCGICFPDRLWDTIFGPFALQRNAFTVI